MPEPDQPPEPGRAARRAQKTRQRLLESALYIFTHRGIDSCSIEDITEHADVGKGTFYRHFDDKLAVLRSLTDAAVAELLAAIREQARGATTLNELLDRVLSAQAIWIQRQPAGFRMLLQVQAMLTVRPQELPGLQPPLQTLVAETESLLRTMAPSQTDPTSLQRLAVASVSTLSGALAFQQASLGGDQTDLAGALRPVFAAALPQLLRCTV